MNVYTDPSFLNVARGMEALPAVSAAVVQKLAGHAPIAITVKYYTGVMPKALRAAQAKLPFDGVISDTSNPDRGRNRGRKREAARVVSPSRAAS